MSSVRVLVCFCWIRVTVPGQRAWLCLLSVDPAGQFSKVLL